MKLLAFVILWIYIDHVVREAIKVEAENEAIMESNSRLARVLGLHL